MASHVEEQAKKGKYAVACLVVSYRSLHKRTVLFFSYRKLVYLIYLNRLYIKHTDTSALLLLCASVLACCCYNVRLLPSTETKMDSQKDVQPPKQQPMIYICGGKGNIFFLKRKCQ